MSSHTIPGHQQVKIIDPVVNDWFKKLPPQRQAVALCYLTGIVNYFNDMGILISEQAALEMVYKCGLFVTANGGKAK